MIFADQTGPKPGFTPDAEGVVRPRRHKGLVPPAPVGMGKLGRPNRDPGRHAERVRGEGVFK